MTVGLDIMIAGFAAGASLCFMSLVFAVWGQREVATSTVPSEDPDEGNSVAVSVAVESIDEYEIYQAAPSRHAEAVVHLSGVTSSRQIEYQEVLAR
jgi:hypothetical protein